MSTVNVEASSGDVHIKAVQNDNGLRSWQVTHGDDYYSYTSRNGIDNPDNFDIDDVERTDVINISSDGTRYTGEFCVYSADATIFKEDESDEPFMRSAPDYGNEPASEEFIQGWDTISNKHEEVLKEFAANPNYIKASNSIKEQLEQKGVNPDEFFNKPSNKLIEEDALKGDGRVMGSSPYWKDELDNLDAHLMNPENVPSINNDADIPTPENNPAAPSMMSPM